MEVVGTQKLHEFKNKHPDIRKPIDSWLCEVKEAQWNNTHDIKMHYASASFLSGNRIVFNIKGGNYRLLVKVDFQRQLVLIKDIATHEDYNKWRL